MALQLSGQTIGKEGELSNELVITGQGFTGVAHSLRPVGQGVKRRKYDLFDVLSSKVQRIVASALAGFQRAEKKGDGKELEVIRLYHTLL